MYELSENMSLKEKMTDRELISMKFSQGKIAFKITTPNLKDGTLKDYGMVNTKEDYEKKLCGHLYNPLLFVIDLGLRIAYLYDCLNRQFKNDREEEYIFFYRELRTNEWKNWFRVKSYIDDVYKELPAIEYMC